MSIDSNCYRLEITMKIGSSGKFASIESVLLSEQAICTRDTHVQCHFQYQNGIDYQCKFMFLNMHVWDHVTKKMCLGRCVHNSM